MHPTEKRIDEPNVSPTRVVKQHHVPAFMLRRFASSDERITCRNLRTDRVRRRPSPTAAGYEPSYFDLAKARGFSLSLESWLQETEARVGPFIGTFVADPSSIESMPQERLHVVARFLASLRFRSPAFREEYERVRTFQRDWARQMIDGYCDRAGVSKETKESWLSREVPFFSDDVPVSAVEAVAAHLAECDDYARLLRSMHWRLGISPKPLFLSDNPLAGAYLSKPFGPGGFGDLTYYLPLAPQVLLRLTPPKNLDDPPLRERRDFSTYEASVASTVVAGDAHTYLYGESPPWTRESAKKELGRLETLAGHNQWAMGQGDRYSKDGLWPIFQLVSPDDPDWHGPVPKDWPGRK
ncbi:MAG: DUF4238 domain-containing protein [Dehalococcoidia bacterium]